MSDEKGKCVDTLDEFKDLSLSSLEALESENIEIARKGSSAEIISSLEEVPHKSGSTESSALKNDPIFEEKGKCVDTLEKFKDLSLSFKETLESENSGTERKRASAEIVSSLKEVLRESGSTRNSALKSDLISVKCALSDFDSTKYECVNKTDNSHEVQHFGWLNMGTNEVRAAAAKIRKAMKDNDVHLEESLQSLKSYPKSSEHSGTSLRRIRDYSSSDTTSDGDSEMSLEVKKLLANQFSMSSGYCTPPISSSVTPQSTEESGDSSARSSTSDMPSGKRSARSDSLETLVTERSPSTLPWSSINNSFFYSPATQRIRKHYNALFDFYDFKHACSLNSNAYRKYLNIKYISLPLSRFLMEDLLDFIDFLNGTEIDLREKRSNLCPSNSRDVKLAFVRDSFEIGVQQGEYQTIGCLLEELDRYNRDQTKASSSFTSSDKTSITQSKSDSNEAQQDKSVFCPKIVSECSDSSKEFRKSYQFLSLEMYRIMRIEPEIENLEDPFVAEHLVTLNEEVRRLMIRCMSDTRMVLDICITTKYVELDKQLRKYFPGIEILLHRLRVLREDCGMLLGTLNGQNNSEMTLHILKVKIQIASALQKLLLKLSEINSEFLDNSSTIV